PGTLFLAAHPGSGSPEKNWPEEKWRELLVKLGGISRVRLVLVGGEAEEDRLARLFSELSKEQLELVHNQPLPQLASRLAACDGFIGHDSGITHLAAAMGTPVIALWGRSAFPVWRPCGSKVMVI